MQQLVDRVVAQAAGDPLVAAVPPAMAHLRTNFSYLQRLQINGAATLLSVIILSLSRQCPPGWRRAVLLPPIVMVNVVLPLLFNDADELLTRLSVAFLISWLASFKVGGWRLAKIAAG